MRADTGVWIYFQMLSPTSLIFSSILISLRISYDFTFDCWYLVNVISLYYRRDMGSERFTNFVLVHI
jgi:hypothetical protein